MTEKEEPHFWKDPECATAYADSPAPSFQKRCFLCRQCLLNIPTSSICRGGCGRGRLQPTGSQWEKRELRANLLQGLDGNIPQTWLSAGKERGAPRQCVGRWGARGAAVGMLAAAGPASEEYDSTACCFRLSVRSEFTVVLTFSAFTFLWTLCLAFI